MENTDMKKNYLSPELQVIKIHTQQMLAASVIVLGLDGLDVTNEVQNNGLADAPNFVLEDTDFADIVLIGE